MSDSVAYAVVHCMCVCVKPSVCLGTASWYTLVTDTMRQCHPPTSDRLLYAVISPERCSQICVRRDEWHISAAQPIRLHAVSFVPTILPGSHSILAQLIYASFMKFHFEFHFLLAFFILCLCCCCCVKLLLRMYNIFFILRFSVHSSGRFIFGTLYSICPSNGGVFRFSQSAAAAVAARSRASMHFIFSSLLVLHFVCGWYSRWCFESWSFTLFQTFHSLASMLLFIYASHFLSADVQWLRSALERMQGKEVTLIYNKLSFSVGWCYQKPRKIMYRKKKQNNTKEMGDSLIAGWQLLPCCAGTTIWAGSYTHRMVRCGYSVYNYQNQHQNATITHQQQPH